MTLRLRFILGTCILLLALWLREPSVSSGLPYLYDEDEGHHFNRIVQMLKSGSFHPHYFLKPALHFYLRLPVTAFAFLREVSAGGIRELHEVQTKNPFGLSGYEFTASHPRLVLYNRWFSVLLALGTIMLLLRIGTAIGRSAAGMFAALLLALAPGHLELSAQIGVDVLMTLCVLLALFFTIEFCRRGAFWRIALGAVAAGLALAAKYNAVPVVAIPLLGWALHCGHCVRGGKEVPPPLLGATALLLIMGVGFLLGAPYSLLALPEFLNGMAYEVWHYKLSNGAPTGLPQALFYLQWLGSHGIGWLPLAAGIAGLLALFWRADERTHGVLIAVFPVTYFALMSAQQVNFTRNMIVILPFLALAAGVLLEKALGVLPFKGGRRGVTAVGLLLALSCQPLWGAFSVRTTVVSSLDSRDQLSAAIEELSKRGESVAVPGELLLPHAIRQLPGVRQVNLRELTSSRTTRTMLWEEGVSYFVLPQSASAVEQSRIGKVLIPFGKGEFPSRVVRDPAVSLLESGQALRNEAVVAWRAQEDVTARGEWRDVDGVSQLEVPLTELSNGWGMLEHGTVPGSALSSYRWMEKRVASVAIPKPTAGSVLGDIAISCFSPWEGQELQVLVDGHEVGTVPFPTREMQEARLAIDLPLRELQGRDVRIDFVSRITRSPLSAKLSVDPRRLATAFARIAITSK